MGAKIFLRGKAFVGEAGNLFMKYNIEPTRGTMLTGKTRRFRGSDGGETVILRDTAFLTDEDGWGVFRDQICAEFKRAPAGTEQAVRCSGSRKKSQGDGEKPEGLRKAGAGKQRKRLFEAEAAQREEEKAAGEKLRSR